MRMKNPADALFPKIRQNILAATYSQPEKWWFLSELAAFMKVSPSSLQRELESLAGSAILRKRRDGNRLYFQAETESPIYIPLRDLIIQILGITAELKESLASISLEIFCAFIYGSMAHEKERATSDVDLMIIGEAGLAELAPVLRRLENKFNREINVTCFRLEEFRQKIKASNHFLTSILNEKKLFLIGDEHELDRLTK